MGVQLLYGKWISDRDHAVHTNLGFGWTFLNGPTRTTIQLARQRTLDCNDCHGLLGGIDVSIPLVERVSKNESAILLSLNPAAGFGHALGWDDWNANAAALSMPLAAKLSAGSELQLIPFVSPGAGIGHYSASREAHSRSYTMLAYGLMLNFRSFPLKLTGGARTYFKKGEALVWGFGLSTLD